LSSLPRVLEDGAVVLDKSTKGNKSLAPCHWAKRMTTMTRAGPPDAGYPRSFLFFSRFDCQARDRRADNFSSHGSGHDSIAVTFLCHVVRTEGFATVPQRVRAACKVLEVGGFLWSETRSTGAFREPEGTEGAGEREET
jgi:hypothetical protein